MPHGGPHTTPTSSPSGTITLSSGSDGVFSLDTPTPGSDFSFGPEGFGSPSTTSPNVDTPFATESDFLNFSDQFNDLIGGTGGPSLSPGDVLSIGGPVSPSPSNITFNPANPASIVVPEFFGPDLGGGVLSGQEDVFRTAGIGNFTSEQAQQAVPVLTTERQQLQTALAADPDNAKIKARLDQNTAELTQAIKLSNKNSNTNNPARKTDFSANTKFATFFALLMFQWWDNDRKQKNSEKLWRESLEEQRRQNAQAHQFTLAEISAQGDEAIKVAKGRAGPAPTAVSFNRA